TILFGVGLLNASIFSASILPLATSYYVCEAFGFESGIDRKFKQAPVFYTLYTLMICIGAGVVLIPHVNLEAILLLSQVANGILLPFILIYMLLLINNKKLMGKYVNSPVFNWIAWTTTIIMIGLTLALLVTSIPGL
ncbi:MAG: divalent metal cation transporter, partial [Firmicutes bacterium]|nr:divalent metal cation transporter [Bacillota bacterium]